MTISLHNRDHERTPAENRNSRPVREIAERLLDVSQFIEKIHTGDGNPAGLGSGDPAGLLVKTDCDPDRLSRCLAFTRLCVIEVDHFADGRGFSLVAMAARTPGYFGQVRVRGDVIADQVGAYFRCGADEVVIAETVHVAHSTKSRRPRYQRVAGDLPGIDTLIPQQRRSDPADPVTKASTAA